MGMEICVEFFFEIGYVSFFLYMELIWLDVIFLFKWNEMKLKKVVEVLVEKF